jgi:hypothetical protein
MITRLDSQLGDEDRDEIKFLLEQWWVREVEGKMNTPGWISYCRKTLLEELTGLLNGFVVGQCGGAKGD